MTFERAPQMILGNMTTGEARAAQFNPEQFEEGFGVNYASLPVVGLSHTRKHYINTEDVKFDLRCWRKPDDSKRHPRRQEAPLFAGSPRARSRQHRARGSASCALHLANVH
jgi:hypothetical protein